MNTVPTVSDLNAPPVRRPGGRWLLGLALLGVGTLALLDAWHVSHWPLLRTFWPLVLMGVGAFRCWQPGSTGRRVTGALMLVAGGLLLAHRLGVASIDWKLAAPVGLMALGVTLWLTRRTHQ